MTFLARMKGALGLKPEKVAAQPKKQLPRFDPPLTRSKPEAKGLTRARAMKAKPRKSREGDDPAYLAAVRALPCCICAGWGHQQTTPTEAHHAICGRGSQNKTPDRRAIPLCRHHRTGADGIHTRRAWWVESFGADTDFIAPTQDAVAGQLTKG